MRRTIQHLIWLGCAVLSPVLGSAQNEEDALRYSWALPGGTARSWAMGSAMGAVGADPGSASLNPAGFGLYNTSEFSITPGLEVNEVASVHYGTAASGTETRAFVNNFAAILYYPGKNGSQWRSRVFGISYDRQNSYHQERVARGEQVNSTLLQNFVSVADGTPSADLFDAFPFGSALAWETYGMDPLDTLSNTYVSAIPYGDEVEQVHTIISSGKLQTTSFFFSTNWADRIYLGASMGIVGSRFTRQTVHTETTDTLDLRTFTYTEELTTTGGGIDLKVGLVGRVTDQLRLGIAYHSPRWMQLDDAYFTRLSTSFRTPDSQGNSNYSASSPDGFFSYGVKTAWNIVGSAAYIVAKQGLVSVDYAYSDQRRMLLKRDNTIPDSYDFAFENSVIGTNFTGTSSVRVGTEWRAGNWYFRGGYGWWQDPYADVDPRQGSGYTRYTGGVGYRTTHVSVDFTAAYGTGTTNYFQYDQALVLPTNETRRDYRSLITLAYRP
jgi:hypothetical protein